MKLYFKHKKVSLISVLFIALFSFSFTAFFIHWGNLKHPFVNDVNQYYSYLNALFIEHDLSFIHNVNSYWLIETPSHHFVPKVTYGMAFFYAPFYLLAKALSGGSPTGYEPVYAWSVHLGCIFYITLGLWFTRKTLLFWFNEFITAISLILLFFGTNLFYYTLSESESVHGVLFCLISVFLYNVVKWHESGSKNNFFLFCLLAGFICLIRPTECLILLFPLGIGLTTAKGIKAKFQRIGSLNWNLLLSVVLFLLPLLPQMLYWKMQSGSYLFFSYGGNESFFWKDPQFVNVFFSFRKGFLIYTPIMVFGLLGFIQLYKKNRGIFYPVFLYFLTNSYLICAWWDWSYGGSFGLRAFVHCFAILVIPFTYFIDWTVSLFRKSFLGTLFVFSISIISLFFCLLNLLQSNLYKHQLIHYDGMNKEAYKFTFLKKRYTEEDIQYLTTLFKSPDYEARRKGIRDE